MSADPWGRRLSDLAVTRACEMLGSKALERGWYPVTEDEAKIIERARGDFWTFFTYCFRDQFGRPFDVQDFQRELFDVLREHQFTLTELPNECAKTTLHEAIELWKLAHRPESTAIVLVSLTFEMACKLGDGIRLAIENNVRLHRVFLRLVKGGLWQRGRFSVAGNHGRIPSVQCVGVVRGKVNGDRITDARLDDIVDDTTCRSRAGQNQLVSWIESVVISRLMKPPANDPRPGGFASAGDLRLCGTPWTSNDALAQLSKKHGVHIFKRPVVRTDGPDPVSEILAMSDADMLPRLLWPAKWDCARVREAIDLRGRVNFCRTLLMLSRDPVGAYFQDGWILRALRNGETVAPIQQRACKGREKAAIGYDLASGERKGADDNAMAAVLLDAQRFTLMSVEDDSPGRWDQGEHCRRIVDHAKRYPQATHVAEDNLALGMFSRWATQITGVQIKGTYAGAKKWDSQVGVAGVQLTMERGMWIFPARYTGEDGASVDLVENGETVTFIVAPWLAKFIGALQDMTEGDRHLPDALAAVWVAFMELGGVPAGAAVARAAPAKRPPVPGSYFGGVSRGGRRAGF